MPAISAELLDAYRATVYRVHAPDGAIELRIGAANPALDALLARHTVDRAAFVTACNPMSDPRAAAENAAASARLHEDIVAAGFACLSGEGIDPTGRWPVEISFLVLGISPAAAAGLATQYRQAAFVYHRCGAAPEVVLTAQTFLVPPA